MYNIKDRQIQNAIARRPSRVNMLELIKKSDIKLTKTEKENILIFGIDFLNFTNVLTSIASDDVPGTSPEEFSDYEVLKELLSDCEPNAPIS